MKIISFGTDTFEAGHNDLTIFFELTDPDYKKLKKTKFCDIYEMYQHLKEVSVGYYNTQLFEQNDALVLSGDVFNHTDKRFITPQF